MSDSDDLDLEGGDSSDSGGSQKKKGGGLGNLLPSILKFVAIGLGALIFIVTISVITYNIMNKSGKSRTVVSDPSSPYMGKRPEYAMYTLIGSVSTKTKDPAPGWSVTVEVIIGYDINDNAASVELTSRQYELRDFVRRYFTGKYATDLAPEREEEIKREIREQLNTRFLDTARARIILFNKLDVMEAF
ncbi:MAG: flagellar basal body protein FliL [Treponema sp.]|jgi:flagellar FliL protein|nr:flagellar basal body protein FliL [Treponema sp.]